MYKNMTRSLLKTGMLVVLANEETYLVFGNRLVSKSGFLWLNNYSEQLKYKRPGIPSPSIEQKYEIFEIYDVSLDLQSVDEILTTKSSDTLIWKRKTKKDFEKDIKSVRNQITHFNNQITEFNNKLAELLIESDGA
jgi:hypothetical protein